jgi:hypothetical protein
MVPIKAGGGVAGSDHIAALRRHDTAGFPPAC